MRKRAILASVIVAIVVISAATALSRPGWRGNRDNCLRRGDGGEPVTLEGKIKDSERPEITMDVDGTEHMLHVGPFWYWQEKGYTVEEGQDVKVTGAVEEIDGVLHVYPQIIEMDGKSIELTDENGMPIWAGRRGGRGLRSARGYSRRGSGPGSGRRGRGQRAYGRGHSRGRRGSRGCSW